MKNNKYSIESITDEDIKNVWHYNSTYSDLIKAQELTKKIKNKLDVDEPMWCNMVSMVMAYKLGEMQGKRQERAKKGNNYMLDSEKIFYKQLDKYEKTKSEINEAEKCFLDLVNNIDDPKINNK